MKGELFSIERFSLHDGPGIRTTVFFKGCTLRCIWCHNPESHERGRTLQFVEKDCVGCGACEQACEKAVHKVEGGCHQINRSRCVTCGSCTRVCPAEALMLWGRQYTVEEVMQEIRKDLPYYRQEGGVTISGGEPLMQEEFAEALLKACKKEGIGTCVETAGFVSAEAVKRILPVTDLFLFDYKLDTQEESKRYLGGDRAVILNNLEQISRFGTKVLLRCPLIPGINDTREHLAQIAQLVKKYGLTGAEIMPYHTYGADKWKQAGKRYELSKIKEMSVEEGRLRQRELDKLIETNQ